MTDLNVRARFEITPAGGKPAVYDSFDTPSFFSRVRVELTTGKASQAEVALFDPDFKFLNQYTRKDGPPAAIVRVWLGYGEDLREPVFKGVLARVERGRQNTKLRAYDMGYLMRLIQRAGYQKGRDIDIMRRLVVRNKTPAGKSLLFQGPPKSFPAVTVNSTIQDQRTDWDFLAELAAEAGLVLWVRDDTVFAAEPAEVGEPALTLEYEHDALLAGDYDLSYKVPENVAGSPKLVTHRGRGRGGRRLEGRSSAGTRGREELIIKRDLRHHSKAVAQRRAEARRKLERENTFEVRLRHLRPLRAGRVDVRDTVEVVNLGHLFSGRYVVDAVTYDVSSRGFETAYDLYRK